MIFYGIAFAAMVVWIWADGRIRFRKPVLLLLMVPPTLGIPGAFLLGLGVEVTEQSVSWVLDPTEAIAAVAFGLGPYLIARQMRGDRFVVDD